MSGAIDFEAARARRDAGMQASQWRAEEEEAGWAALAYIAMCAFAEQETQPWTCEQFRAWATQDGLADSPDSRSFGGGTQRALRAGVIVRVGYAPTASSNGSVKPLYSRPVQGVAA